MAARGLEVPSDIEPGACEQLAVTWAPSSAVHVTPVGRVQPGGQPPASATADEHEQGKLVERVGSPRLFVHSLGQREPPHVATSAWTCRALAAAIIFKWIEWISS